MHKGYDERVAGGIPEALQKIASSTEFFKNLLRHWALSVGNVILLIFIRIEKQKEIQAKFYLQSRSSKGQTFYITGAIEKVDSFQLSFLQRFTQQIGAPRYTPRIMISAITLQLFSFSFNKSFCILYKCQLHNFTTNFYQCKSSDTDKEVDVGVKI